MYVVKGVLAGSFSRVPSPRGGKFFWIFSVFFSAAFPGVVEAVALTVGLQDVDAVGQPVEQGTLDTVADWATGWVRVCPDLQPGPGMFVARVHGDAMSPDVPAGAYCVFRPVTGDREGRVLLVAHSAIMDALTGGQYTLRRYISQPVESDSRSMLSVSLEASGAGCRRFDPYRARHIFLGESPLLPDQSIPLFGPPSVYPRNGGIRLVRSPPLQCLYVGAPCSFRANNLSLDMYSASC
jgi:hypothetical protein